MSGTGYSVAVLPFVNMCSDPENEYFSDGITEEIINALTKIEGLLVTARTSCFAFKGKNMDVRQIGRQLGVQTVLEGSVRRAGTRVRITTQLISVADGYHLWSDNFDRDLEDIFAVQDEISLRIAEKLREHLGHFYIQERLVDSPTQNIEAYQLYLKGRFYGNKWTEDDFGKAIRLYERAIDLEPSFALPYAGIADLFSAMGAFGIMQGEEAYQKAREFAYKALDLNDKLAECHIALAHIYFWFDWEFKKARQELRYALELVPGNAEALGFLGLFKAFSGAMQDGKVMLENAIKVDPYSLQLHFAMCAVCQITEDYQRANEEADIVLQLNPQFIRAKGVKGYVAYQTGQYKKAIQIFNDCPVAPEVNGETGWLACCYQKLGEKDQAQQYLLQTKELLKQNLINPCAYYALVLYYTNEGEIDQAFCYLEEGLKARISDFVFIKLDPSFKHLHNHPKFQRLIQRIERITEGREKENKTRYLHSRLRAEDGAAIDQRLRQLMEIDKLYLDSQLCLRQLAEALNINTNYLSQVINERHGKNFFEFINQYRVGELKAKLEDPKNRQFTLLSLAFDCGFNSKTTFNTAFKRITGFTPSQYLKKVG